MNVRNWAQSLSLPGHGMAIMWKIVISFYLGHNNIKKKGNCLICKQKTRQFCTIYQDLCGKSGNVFCCFIASGGMLMLWKHVDNTDTFKRFERQVQQMTPEKPVSFQISLVVGFSWQNVG